MTARLYIDDINGTYTEVVDRVRLLDWTVHEQAEEGSGAMSTVVFDDPDMDWDVVPWTRWYLVEDTSEDANSVICGGWVTEQEIGRQGDDRENRVARFWSVSLTDANAYWHMRVMVGSDANRPAETDVERMQWLLATNEMAWASDVTTYVSTASPVAMDAVDYRGKMLNEIVSDCSQPPTGKNWYTWIELVGGVRKVIVWYGKDDWAVRDSPLSLSNDLADFVVSEVNNGTSLVYPISEDTKLKRDPTRMYDGTYLEYTGGAVYRATNPRTVRRDVISPNPLVKSKAKAIARADAYLVRQKEQDLVITASVELPAAKATMLRAGMRVQFRATHLPAFEDFRWCRVLSCAVTPVAAGDRYRLKLELVPVGVYVPTVKWVFLHLYGTPLGEFALDVSDDGSSWTTLLTGSQLAAGTVNPPHFPDRTVGGLVEIPEEDWAHRYWRLSHVWVHSGGYYGGLAVDALRLLSGSDYDAVCRLRTVGGGAAWYDVATEGCSGANEPPCWTGDIPYAAVTNAPPGLSGTPAGSGTCDADPNRGSSFSGTQGCGYGVHASVLGPGTFTTTWTFDLLEGA